MTYDLGVFKRQRYTSPAYNGLGGTISYYTSNGVAYTVHTFLSTGTTALTIFSTATVDILLVGGGGAGLTGDRVGGGGGGQFVTTSTTLDVGQYNVTVGTGGSVSAGAGSSSSIVGVVNVTYASTATGGAGGTGTDGGAGAGGAAVVKVGGAGLYNDYNGTTTAYAGGGGGGSNGGGDGGVGGGGQGGTSGSAGQPGTANSGGGGGGGGGTTVAGAGGSGIVIIRYQTPRTAIIPPTDQYFNYVSLLLSNQTLDVITPTTITSNNFPIEYLIVGGGGAGGGSVNAGTGYGGGGGAGGVIFGTSTNFLLPGVDLTITVGAGATASLSNSGANGNDGQSSSIVSYSIFGTGAITTSTLIAFGGGGGGYVNSTGAGKNGSNGSLGGSGGGGGAGNSLGYGGTATQSAYTFTTALGLGYAGGNGSTGGLKGGGGGGAGGAGGTNGSVGPGFTWVDGITYAAGGDSALNNAVVNGVRGGGGSGINYTSSGYTGGGGDGVVIIRYSGTNVLATGGTISTVSNYVYHTFDSSGVLSVTAASTTTRYSYLGYLLVAGGGGGAGSNPFSGSPGAGGAGGLITGTFTITNLSNLLTISVGAGGSAGFGGAGQQGGSSAIIGNYVNKITYGGGGGAGGSGGSGGGASGTNPGTTGAGAATQPSSAYGGYGNDGSTTQGGGGGGAGAAGSGTIGGSGLYVNTPSSTYSRIYSQGGSAGTMTAGPATTGYGGGSGAADGAGGGSGISILWEPILNPMPTIFGKPTVLSTSGYRVYVFTSTGALLFGNSLSNNNISDNSTNRYILSPSGNPTPGSFNPYSKTWSVYLDGSSYLTIPNTTAYGTTGLGLGSSDFTIEGWVYFNSVASGRIIGHGSANTNAYTVGAWRIELTSSGSLTYSVSNTPNLNVWDIASNIVIGSVSVGTWYHFAVVRIGSQFSTYLNGVAGATASSSAAVYSSTYNLHIGALEVGGGGSAYVSGYISNIRIIKGTGYYTGTFSPAIGTLPLITNTLLLTCVNSQFDDLSTYSWPILLGGSPIVKKFSPFSNFGSYNTTLVGGSTFFNGSTDYINVISTSTSLVPNWTYLHDGTTDYTIEGWIYPLSTASTMGLIGTSDISNTAVSGMALYLTSGGVLSWAMMNGSASFSSGTSSNSVRPNSWNHIACTFSSSSKTTTIYVNGFKLGTTATTTSSFVTTAASYPLTIGRYTVSSINSYSGYLSNLRLLKGVISDGVVASGISAGSTIEYLIVAGGGGAPSSGNGRGGGGGGGFRTGTFITTQSGAIYTITVGSGGAGGNVTPTNGGNSSIVGGGLSLVSAGGGTSNGINVGGSDGGSGGGSGVNSSTKPGGAGNTPPTVPPQGYDGGGAFIGGSATGGSGGGGAGGPGQSAVATTNQHGGDGGPGALSNIDGLGYYYAGGGGGVGADRGVGGIGGGAGLTGGDGGRNPAGNTTTGNGGLNTGGGGYGGITTGGAGSGGGSGCVIVRYFGPQQATGGNIITTNISGYTVHTFLSTGVFVDNSTSYTIPLAPVVAASTNTNLLINSTESAIIDAAMQNDIYTALDASLSSVYNKFNKMSMFFDGSGDALIIANTSTSAALGSVNFTVEMWIYPLASYNSGTAPALLDARTTANGAGLIRFGFNGTTLVAGPQIAWVENVTTLLTATVVLNVWQHIAVVRNNGELTMYNNGTVISTASNSTNLIVPFKYIGKSYDNLYWNGYMDDLRITNGIARYTTAFIPPTYAPQLK